MEIEWVGGSRFRLTGVDGRVAIDPFPAATEALAPEEASARAQVQVVTLSDARRVAQVRGPTPTAHRSIEGPFLVRGAGEYEVHRIYVTAVWIGDSEPDSPDGPLAANVLLDDIAVCHLGRLRSAPLQDEVDMLGEIDVLLVPIGGDGTLDPAGAAEVVSALDPSIVIPMCFDPTTPEGASHADRFLNALGFDPMDPLSRLTVSRTLLPEELQAVVLAPRD